MKSALRIGGKGELNIFVKSGAGLLGWATLPDSASGNDYDAVVIESETVPGGTFAPYNEGDTLTHEVGKFGLVLQANALQHITGLRFDPSPLHNRSLAGASPYLRGSLCH